MTKDDIIQLVEDEDVGFIRLQFTDMLGHMRNMAITASKLVDALDNKCTFDASAVKGFAGMSGEELFLYPVPDTFTIFPWRPHQGKVARLICDVYTADGQPIKDDPRHILKNVLSEADKMGYAFDVNPECEFFLFKTDDEGRPTLEPNDEAGYFDLAPLDNGENCRRDICLTLEEMGYTIESSHHETARGQHEIIFRNEDALTTADKLVTFRTVVKTIAKRNGLHATFMPKPKENDWGSGMHLTMSLFKNGKNAFFDEAAPDKLSDVCKSFLAGILKYIPDMTCIMNPTINSYKRFVPGFEAPCFISWSENNKSLLVKILKSFGETRIKLCSPDSTANPYLAIAACLKAGLAGIKENIPLPPSVDFDPYTVSEKEREKNGVYTLPMSLDEAVKLARKSEFMTELLGEDFKERYLEAKEREYFEYRKTVGQWEIDRYFMQY